MKDFQHPKPMTKCFFWWVVFPLVIIFLCVIWLGFSHGQDLFDTYRSPNPLDWIAKYQGRRMGCCGHQDCIPVRMRILHEWFEGGQEVYDIEFFRVGDSGNTKPFIIREFPKRAVHVSENEFDYFCFVPQNWTHTHETIYNDPCVTNPALECSNCFFWAPKG